MELRSSSRARLRYTAPRAAPSEGNLRRVDSTALCARATVTSTLAYTLTDTLTDTPNDTLTLRKGRSLPFLLCSARLTCLPQVFAFAFAAALDAWQPVYTTAVAAITDATTVSATSLADARAATLTLLCKTLERCEVRPLPPFPARLCPHRRNAALITARRDARARRLPHRSSPRRSSSHRAMVSVADHRRP